MAENRKRKKKPQSGGGEKQEDGLPNKRTKKRILGGKREKANIGWEQGIPSNMDRIHEQKN
jgi:hypothetical protein